MELTKAQKSIIIKLQCLLGMELKGRSVRRNVLVIDLPLTFQNVNNRLYAEIEKIVTKYELGSTEKNGVHGIAIRH